MLQTDAFAWLPQQFSQGQLTYIVLGFIQLHWAILLITFQKMYMLFST